MEANVGFLVFFSVSKQKIILNVVANSSANSSKQFCADLLSEEYFTEGTLSCSSVVHGTFHRN